VRPPTTFRGEFMSRAAAVFAVMAIVLQPCVSAELEGGEQISLATRFTISSEVLDKTRNVLVYLPQTYGAEANRERRYPVLYLLDGAAYFNATIGVVHHLSARSAAVERIPEHIIVAIANTKRTRDMTPSHMTEGLYSDNSGGAAIFRKFLENDLIPAIDTRYRTTGERVLVGHSLAGLFVIDTLVEQPSLFSAYIAIDPSLSWDSNLLARKLGDGRSTPSNASARLFIGEANTPTMTAADRAAQRAGIAEFRTALEKRKWPIRDSYRYFEDETHLSVPMEGIYRGLLSIYDDYKKP